jgi:hypothetical protein
VVVVVVDEFGIGVVDGDVVCLGSTFGDSGNMACFLSFFENNDLIAFIAANKKKNDEF